MLEMPKAQGQSLNMRLVSAFQIFSVSAFRLQPLFEHLQPDFNLRPAAFQTRISLRRTVPMGYSPRGAASYPVGFYPMALNRGMP
jgi:hypothetical protein